MSANSLRLRILVVAFALALAAGAGCAEPTPNTEVTELAKLADKYQIEFAPAKDEFKVDRGTWAITGTKAADDAVAGYAKVLAEEFGLYPPELVRRAKLRRVVLCDKLVCADQRRAAVPDFGDGVLYLDVTGRGSQNRTYCRKALHHEFYHIVNHRTDGLSRRDERWSSLNPADFKYGTGGASAQNRSDTSVLTDKVPGFLNHYSTTAMEEDKAEVFANLLVDPTYIATRADRDPTLKAKARRMKEMTSAFCPQADDAFWNKARDLKRSGP